MVALIIVNIENLEKFNFAGFPRTSTVPQSRQRLDATMSVMTPLSIARPLPSSRSRISTFEDNVKRKSLYKVSEPQYSFGDSYRDYKPHYKKEKSLSPTKTKLRSLQSPVAATGSNTETSPSSRRGGSSATGSDTSLFKPSSSQGRYTLRSAGKENDMGGPHRSLISTPPQAPKPNTPRVFSSPDASQSSTGSTLTNTSAGTSQPGSEPRSAYRASIYSSDVDADDEQSNSDLETETGNDKENTDLDFLAYTNKDNDDRLGLHLELGRISIGEKRRRSPEDGDNEATDANALGEKSWRIKEEEDEHSMTPSCLLLEYPSFEEERRENARLQRSNENRNPAAGLPGHTNTPAKRVRLSDAEEQLTTNKRATARDRLDLARAVDGASTLRESLDWELALAEADSTKRIGKFTDL